MTTPTLDLDGLKALRAQATAEPWEAFHSEFPSLDELVAVVQSTLRNQPSRDLFGIFPAGHEQSKLYVGFTGNGPTSAANAAYIVALVNAAEALIAAAEERDALRAENATLREKLTAWERAADELMVANWIGVYDPAEDPKQTIHRIACGYLDPETAKPSLNEIARREAAEAENATLRAALLKAHTAIVSLESLIVGEFCRDFADTFTADYEAMEVGKRAIADVLTQSALTDPIAAETRMREDGA